LLAGEIDVYVDYLPTAVPQYLNLQPPKTAAATYRAVRDGARQRWCVEWLSAFGFNNTYAVIVRRALAAELGAAHGLAGAGRASMNHAVEMESRAPEDVAAELVDEISADSKGVGRVRHGSRRRAG